jgi:hypothetical protein
MPNESMGSYFAGQGEASAVASSASDDARKALERALAVETVLGQLRTIAVEHAERIKALETEFSELKKNVTIVRYVEPGRYTTQPEIEQVRADLAGGSPAHPLGGKESGDLGAATSQPESVQSQPQSQS